LATQSLTELSVFLCLAANLDSLENTCLSFLFDFIANLTAILHLWQAQT